MNVLDFVASVVGAGLLFLGTVVTVRNGRSKSGVTDKQVESSIDPGVDALKTVLRMEQRLATVEAQAKELIAENRLFRGVIRGTIERLRRVPPLDHSEIVAYILRHIPGIDEPEDDE